MVGTNMDRRGFCRQAGVFGLLGITQALGGCATPNNTSKSNPPVLAKKEADVLRTYLEENHRGTCTLYGPTKYGPQEFPAQYDEDDPAYLITETVDWAKRYQPYNSVPKSVRTRLEQKLLKDDLSAFDDLNMKTVDRRSLPIQQSDFPCFRFAKLDKLPELTEANLVSRVGFNNDSTQALFYQEWHCHGLCGGAGFLLYESQQGKWAKSSGMQLWIS